MRRTALTLLTVAATGAAVLAAVPASAGHGALTVTGLTANDRLVTFTAAKPDTILSEVAITGLAEGDDVESIDFRPATGGLYALVTGAEGARLFLVDPTTGAATRIGTASYPIAGSISIDFNPTVDRLRVVSDDTTNLRVNPNNGALAATDGNLAYSPADAAAGATPRVGGVAYTNNDNDCLDGAACPTTSTGTTLFDVDAALDQLTTQVPPNAGTLNTVGALPQGTKAQATGFDIYTRTNGNRANWAFVSLFDKGRSTFYEIDLDNGGAETVNPVPGSGKQIGTTPHVTDIALAPAQAGF